MSYILDALRKSEKERNYGTGQALYADPPAVPARMSASLWPLFLGSVVIVGMAAAGVIFWHGQPVEESDKLSTSPMEPLTGGGMTAVERESAVESAARAGTERSATPPVYANSQPRDLAEHVRQGAPGKPKRIMAVPAAVTATGPAGEGDTDIQWGSETIPLLKQMPDTFRRHLPAMAVTIHVYSPDESQRILFINNREHHKGEVIAGGVRVVDIVHDGVILSYGGELFRLARPN